MFFTNALLESGIGKVRLTDRRQVRSENEHDLGMRTVGAV